MVAQHKEIIIGYSVACICLSLYGTEVCPFIDNLGIGSTLPVFATVFGAALMLRPTLLKGVIGTPTAGFKTELGIWLSIGVVITLFNRLIFQFPVGSGLKVLVGCIAIGLPTAMYFALLVERDYILSMSAPTEREAPAGPVRSIPKYLYRFVVSAQLFMGLVILLLVFKDLNHLKGVDLLDTGPVLKAITMEIVLSFIVLTMANAIVSSRYAKNLELRLTRQIAGMDAVAKGNLDVLVPIISNDEMGQIGDRTNAMIETLRARAHVQSLFGKLVSPQVAQALLQDSSSSALGGREISATVLFTDIRGFTALSERCKPPEVVSMLNEYFSMLVHVIHQQNGILDKFIGDAAMAVFGLDDTQSPQAINDAAVRAAFEIRAGLLKVNSALEERGLPHIDNGFGIHYGKMVAGNIGSQDRLEFTVIGDAVNVASRLESLCKTTQRWLSVSAATFEHLSPTLKDSLEKVGDYALKGKQDEVTVFGPPCDATTTRVASIVNSH